MENLIEIVEDDACNEVAADDKEYVDPDESPLEQPEAGMKEDYGQHRQRSESVDLSSVIHDFPEPKQLRQNKKEVSDTNPAQESALKEAGLWPCLSGVSCRHRYSHSIVPGGLCVRS